MDWLNSPLDTLLETVAKAVTVYVAVIAITRVGGLRTFAKMSSFDFAMTIATGSVIAAAVVNASTSAMQGVVAFAALVGLQVGVARLRQRSGRFESTVTNTPVILMHGPVIDEQMLDRTRVSRGDLFGKLREANVLRLSEVRLVVLETTGDISVLHATDPERQVDPELLEGVARHPER